MRGREAIVANWLKNRDEPNTYGAQYQPLAVNGNTAVTQGQSIYYKPDGTTIVRKFDNIFVLKFDDEGRCEDFCEWYMQPRTSIAEGAHGRTPLATYVVEKGKPLITLVK